MSRGLPGNEWHAAMEDAEYTQMPAAMRELCAYILVFNMPTEPQQLVDSFWKPRADDIVRQRKRHLVMQQGGGLASSSGRPDNEYNQGVHDVVLMIVHVVMFRNARYT
eukprot:1915799-Pyramimonas_sp.AAC.1